MNEPLKPNEIPEFPPGFAVLKGSGQVEVIGPYGRVYLYTHTNADWLVQNVHTILSKRADWDDEDYLTGRIFCQMLIEPGDGPHGYGIGSQVVITAELLVSVDLVHRLVTLDRNREQKRYTFEHFVAHYLDEARLE